MRAAAKYLAWVNCGWAALNHTMFSVYTVRVLMKSISHRHICIMCNTHVFDAYDACGVGGVAAPTLRAYVRRKQ